MTAPVVTPIRTFRILAGALMAALVVIGIALVFVVGSPGRDGREASTEPPQLWVYLAIVALGLVMAVLVQTVGYRVPAIPPGLAPAQAHPLAFRAYQQSMILRFALSEVVAIVSIAVVFAVQSDTVLPYVVGAVIALGLMAVHVWPGTRVIDRVQRRLDRDGGRSDLAQVLDGTA